MVAASRRGMESQDEAPTMARIDTSLQKLRLSTAAPNDNFRTSTSRSMSQRSYHALLSRLIDLQKEVVQEPYSITLRLSLADAYSSLLYPDLAAGEAYKALLLIDEVADEHGEYHASAFSSAAKDAAVRGDKVTNDSSQVIMEPDGIISWATSRCSEEAYLTLVQSLSGYGDLHNASDLCLQMLRKHPQLSNHPITRKALQSLCKWCDEEGVPFDLEKSIEGSPASGLVRRELYPWNLHEPDRFSEEALGLLNTWMEEAGSKLEVKATELPVLGPSDDTYVTAMPSSRYPMDSLARKDDFSTVADGVSRRPKGTVKQLGLFAKEDLHPAEVVLLETSLLTATSRLHEAFCDACSARLPGINNLTSSGEADGPISCEECDEAVFCSQKCHDMAQEAYHSAICGSGVSSVAKDAPAAEAADALYSLLLLRTLAMAETRDVHPLDLKDVKYIWGDYHEQCPLTVFDADAPDSHSRLTRTLPFSFKYNILIPLNMLEKMNVNIFENDGRYDTWVLNTLYAKFRGTASARQGPDGRPEVGAVHPLWCLANHNCDPNVTWEWEGKMKLWIKEERIQWAGMAERNKKTPGIKKGEEMIHHYCDVSLNVKERREWAAGALGGLCQCERCVWEERQQ